MRILEGAGRAFGRLGYAGCRVEDILDEAGVSRPTFYKFFSGKEEVFDAVEEAFTLSFIHAMEGAVDASLDTGAQAEALVDAYLRWIAGQRSLAHTMFTDLTRPRADTIRDARARSFQAFMDVIRGLAASDARRPADPFVYRGIIGAISEIGLALIEAPGLGEREMSRARASIMRIVAATLADRPDDHVPELPVQDGTGSADEEAGRRMDG